MKYCLRCAREIGEGHEFCPHCGTPQKEIVRTTSEYNRNSSHTKKFTIIGVVVAFLLILLAVALVEKTNSSGVTSIQQSALAHHQEKTFSNPIVSISARQILNEYKNNEIRAGEQYNGKRVRISGCAANIDNTMGILSVFVNSCGGLLDIDYVHAQFPDNAKGQLSRLNKGQKVVVECTVNDGGDIMGVMASNCTLK